MEEAYATPHLYTICLKFSGAPRLRLCQMIKIHLQTQLRADLDDSGTSRESRDHLPSVQKKKKKQLAVRITDIFSYITHRCPLTDVKIRRHRMPSPSRFRANHLTVSLQGSLAGVAQQSERTSSGLRSPGDPSFLQARRELKPRRWSRARASMAPASRCLH